MQKSYRLELYIYITNKDKDCDLLQDRPVLPSEMTPPWQTILQLSPLQPKSGQCSMPRWTHWLIVSHKI